jgi:PAS domain-containing protein
MIVARVFAGALERKRAEAELRESEERLQLAAESADVGMWMLDLTTGRFWANDRGRAIFGFPADVDVTMELFCIRSSQRTSTGRAIRQAGKVTSTSVPDRAPGWRAVVHSAVGYDLWASKPPRMLGHLLT